MYEEQIAALMLDLTDETDHDLDCLSLEAELAALLIEEQLDA